MSYTGVVDSIKELSNIGNKHNVNQINIVANFSHHILLYLNDICTDNTPNNNKSDSSFMFFQSNINVTNIDFLLYYQCRYDLNNQQNLMRNIITYICFINFVQYSSNIQDNCTNSHKIYCYLIYLN